ncbi:MarR family winged helix-turn-helix transcriptional regulator [Curtobacterium ammoniigenes]|uniref:MarR family winged helix-turn-helix transcriptional regulator n=1 Tax=Curtobacterium ammoniigenes TaxID=395387 RepID=UPI000831181D|nr:MarR family transcriptional regulator [Curtobacterium ammoniigenes]
MSPPIPSPPRAAPHASLSTDLRVSVNRLSRRLRNEKADASLPDSLFSALARLDREGAKTLGELSRVEGVTPPSMTKTVAALLDRGLISKSVDDADRRRVLLEPTASGTALVAETRRRRDAWLSPRLARLSPDERKTLAAATLILRRLAQQ